MPFQLPDLPYAHDALEPHIDARTMEIHHGKHHQAYVDNANKALVERDFGSVESWRTDLKATAMAARGWAWTAFDRDEGRLFNYIGDAQNTFPVWNASPLVALDVYEHAYFLDFQTDRASYIEAFFNNLDWQVVNEWVAKYGVPLR